MKRILSYLFSMAIFAVVMVLAGCNSGPESEMKVKIGDQVWDGTNSTFIFKNSNIMDAIVLNIYKDKQDAKAPNVVLYIPRDSVSVSQRDDSMEYLKNNLFHIGYFESASDFLFVNNSTILPHYVSSKGANIDIIKLDTDNNTVSFRAKATLFDAKQKFMDSLQTPQTLELEIIAKNVKCTDQQTGY